MVEKSYLLCWANISEVKGATYLLLLQLLNEFSSTCCRDIPDKTGLIPPNKNIRSWYKISSELLFLTTFPQHEILKIPEIYNDVLEFIWINPDSFIIFLCCTQINRNMHTRHVWNFRKIYLSVFCFACGPKSGYLSRTG